MMSGAFDLAFKFLLWVKQFYSIFVLRFWWDRLPYIILIVILWILKYFQCLLPPCGFKFWLLLLPNVQYFLWRQAIIYYRRLLLYCLIWRFRFFHFMLSILRISTNLLLDLNGLFETFGRWFILLLLILITLLIIINLFPWAFLF